MPQCRAGRYKIAHLQQYLTVVGKQDGRNKINHKKSMGLKEVPAKEKLYNDKN